MSTPTVERIDAQDTQASPVIAIGNESGRTGKRGSALIQYDKCKLYNKHRCPVGIDWLLRRLRSTAARLRLPMRELEMSALCCGTGQNEGEMLRLLNAQGEQIKSLTCIDGSDGMLDWARSSIEDPRIQTAFHQADVLKDELPVERQHAISCIQAVQHFEDSRLCRHFSTLGRFYQRVRTKLMYGGEFFQIVSLPDQVLHSYWFYNLLSGLPGIKAEDDPAWHFAQEHPPLERVFANLESNGFRVRKWKLIRKPHFRAESYYGSPEIILNDEFRHCSSLFWIMQNRGLQERYDEIARQRIADGSAVEHRTRVEQVREQIGISIAISAEAV